VDKAVDRVGEFGGVEDRRRAVNQPLPRPVKHLVRLPWNAENQDGNCIDEGPEFAQVSRAAGRRQPRHVRHERRAANERATACDSFRKAGLRAQREADGGGCDSRPIARARAGGPSDGLRWKIYHREIEPRTNGDSQLAKPCVLRLAPEGNPASSVPFAVADLQLAALQLPIRDSDQYYTWHGEFNRLYDVDQGSELGIPAGATIVAVSMEGKAKPNFILGKDKVVVERLEPVASPAAMKNGTNAIYLMLRGVREEDVRWGPQDVENFWIGTVSGDGKTILECQYLSEMVLEPSGPLDKP
jgi:hypothetical protein